MLSSNDYEKTVRYLLNVPKFAGKNTVEDTERYMEVLGSPGYDKKIIHVAGTNGKGSVCAYLSSILVETGARVGMFTSPHLVEMTERFRLNGKPVNRKRFVDAFQRVMGKLESAREACGKPGYHPSFFELLFLMGMVIFAEENADYIILETGLGGRLDATNAVPHPALTVLTQIGLDHREYLGDTVEQIAAEKAGILKKGVPVVFCDKSKEVSQVIRKRAQALGIPAFPVRGEECVSINLRKKGIDFSVHSRYYDYIRLTLSTQALYQVENAAVAVRSIEVLDTDRRIRPAQIAAGIRKTVWEARMEEILPGVYLDGAHNADGMKAFLETVERDGCRGKRYLLFCVAADKDYKAMLKLLSKENRFSCAAIAKFEGERAAGIEALAQASRTLAAEGFLAFGADRCVYYKTVPEALAFLMHEKKEEDRIYIAGSLYLAGEVKRIIDSAF